MSSYQELKLKKSSNYNDLQTGKQHFKFELDVRNKKYDIDVFRNIKLECPNSSLMSNRHIEHKDIKNLLDGLVESMSQGHQGPYYVGSIGHYLVTLTVYSLTWLLIFGLIVFMAIKKETQPNYYWLMYGLVPLFTLLAILSMADEHLKKKKDSQETPKYTLKQFCERHGKDEVEFKTHDNFRTVELIYTPVLAAPEDNQGPALAPTIKPYTPTLPSLGENLNKHHDSMDYPKKESAGNGLD